MRNRLNRRKSQAGQILIFVTIVLALAAIIIPSVLTLASASHRSTQINKEKTQQFYAADTGVEDALHKMGNGNFTLGNYTIPGDVNGYNVAVRIEVIGEQSVYRITSTATDPLSGTHTDVVTEVPSYTLTINVNEPSWGNTTPVAGNTYTYPGGATVDLLATPGACHDFVNWTGDAGVNLSDPDNDGDATITMNGNYNITANFQWQTSLTVISGTGGNVSVTPPEQNVPTGTQQTFNYCRNTTVNLDATPDGDHTFNGWTQGPVQDPNAASTSIVMNGNYTVQANFVATPTWTLTISHTGNGAVTTPGEGSIPEPKGAEVALVAEPTLPCNRFVNWSGDTGTIGNVSNASTTILMDGNKNIVANFEQIQYTLTITANPPGGGTVSGGGTWPCGTTQPISATPASNYTFVNWTGDTSTIGNTTDPNTTITMNSNYSIVANFAIDSPCYQCWHYAIATFGGPGQNPFQNSGNVNGDIFINSPAGLQNAFVLNGKFYVNGDLTLQNAININDDVYVQGKLKMSNSQRIYGNAYATGDITLQNSATITKSAYSQGSISLTNASQIQGNAHYQGSLSMSTGGSVLGQLYHETVTLPPFPTFTPPIAPEIDAKAQEYKDEALEGGTYTGDMTISSNTSLGATYITGSLTIKNNKTLTLTGTIYVEGTITLQNNSQIIIGGSGGPYAIVASGNIIINNGASVNAAHTSPLPMIMSVNGSVTVSGSSNIGGIIYAPRGTITLSNSVIVYGSVVGQVVNTTNSTVITHAPELDGREGLPDCGCGS